MRIALLIGAKMHDVWPKFLRKCMVEDSHASAHCEKLSERIAEHIVCPFPETNNGSKCIPVIGGNLHTTQLRHSCWSFATTMDMLLRWPFQFQCSHRKNFESSPFQSICGLLRIQNIRTTPFHPQSNGMVVRINKNVNRYFSKVVSDNQKDWDFQLLSDLHIDCSGDNRSDTTKLYIWEEVVDALR